MSEPFVQYIQSQHPYPLLFATIGGSQAFGYANAYSDYDVHGCHLVSLESVLGLDSGRGKTIECKDLVHPENGQGVEVATHELEKFIRLLLNGNCNILEDLYSPLVLHTSDIHQELLELGKGCMTLQTSSCYKGMAANQQRKMKHNETKKHLHIYRCLMMGTYLMETGELEMNMLRLAGYYDMKEVAELVRMKHEAVSESEWTPGLLGYHQKWVESWFERLRDAAAESALPARPGEATRKALEALLIRVRLEGR